MDTESHSSARHLHIDSQTGDRLEIVFGVNTGGVDGTVVNKNGEPVPNAPVALVPDAAHRQRADLHKSARTDELGRFRLQGIAPGGYSLFAWEDIEDGLWRDPDFIRRNEAAGKPARIVEGARVNHQLIAVPFAY